MKDQGHLPARRGVSLLLMTVGLILFALPLWIAPSQGVLAAWISIWPITVCITLGSFLLSGMKLRYATKTMAIALALLLPWSTIYFVPLPSEIRLLLADFIPLVAFLSYRYYRRSGLL